ncbi:MAG: DUF1127 domain-containing protein [Bradyrhizobium sp.]
MPSTTDDPQVSHIKGRNSLRAGMRSHNPIGRPRDCLGSSSQAVSGTPEANVYYLAGAAPDHAGTDRNDVPRLRLWWERWRERRRFARELPWIADEVLEDYGLTREEARRLCRRPFWRA